MSNRILEITFTLILVYLVIANAGNFGVAVSNLSSAYVRSVEALQGRS